MIEILFLDQSGNLGGAELCLLDIATPYKNSCLVSLFADGSFRKALEQHQIPARVLSTQAIKVRKDSNLLQSLTSLRQVVPLIRQVVQLSYAYDLIYANTQKALVVGAIASAISRRPLVYHLHDILSPEHFSQVNRRLAVFLANQFSSLVIANSKATKTAFIEAGGRSSLIEVVYNGLNPDKYQNLAIDNEQLRQELKLNKKFVIGHFSRLSPWKGQHILLQALTCCSEDTIAIFVGDALFGEEDYVKEIHQQVIELGLSDRVHFLGFRSDIPQLMTACDVLTHTSTAPEPFGRVIVEAMLCGKPVVASDAGGAVELIEHGKTGWLTPPGDVLKLAETIEYCRIHPEEATAIAHEAKVMASQRFNLLVTNQQISQLLKGVLQTEADR
jgi:glycosyltransferase involved in cell wall biosynthesis